MNVNAIALHERREFKRPSSATSRLTTFPPLLPLLNLSSFSSLLFPSFSSFAFRGKVRVWDKRNWIDHSLITIFNQRRIRERKERRRRNAILVNFLVNFQIVLQRGLENVWKMPRPFYREFLRGIEYWSSSDSAAENLSRSNFNELFNASISIRYTSFQLRIRDDSREKYDKIMCVFHAVTSRLGYFSLYFLEISQKWI